MSSTQASFLVLAEASPGLLSRLLEPLAKRDLVPDAVTARREGATMRVTLTLDRMPAEAVPLVAGNLRQIIGLLALEVRAPGMAVAAKPALERMAA